MGFLDFFKRSSSTPKPVKAIPDYRPLVAPHKRTAWIPQTETNRAAIQASKFSGLPIIDQDEEWPCCKECKNPMQLFLQLNADELPVVANKPFGDGTLQVFFCTDNDGACDTWEAFSDGSLVRLIQPENLTPKEIKSSPVKNPLPEKRIVAWNPVEDYPNPEELDELQTILDDAQTDQLCEDGYPRSGDKLGGWPYWIQGIEYPNCPDCGERMKLVFQIDSESNLDFMFGDVGCSHITQCPKHPTRLAIAWACH